MKFSEFDLLALTGREMLLKGYAPYLSINTIKYCGIYQFRGLGFAPIPKNNFRQNRRAILRNVELDVGYRWREVCFGHENLKMTETPQ
jgi:hypothetical protein